MIKFTIFLMGLTAFSLGCGDCPKPNLEGRSAYEVLGVTNSVTLKKLKHIYRYNSQLMHPDKFNFSKNGLSEKEIEAKQDLYDQAALKYNIFKNAYEQILSTLNKEDLFEPFKTREGFEKFTGSFKDFENFMFSDFFKKNGTTDLAVYEKFSVKQVFQGKRGLIIVMDHQFEEKKQLSDIIWMPYGSKKIYNQVFFGGMGSEKNGKGEFKQLSGSLYAPHLDSGKVSISIDKSVLKVGSEEFKILKKEKNLKVENYLLNAEVEFVNQHEDLIIYDYIFYEMIDPEITKNFNHREFGVIIKPSTALRNFFREEKNLKTGPLLIYSEMEVISTDKENVKTSEFSICYQYSDPINKYDRIFWDNQEFFIGDSANREPIKLYGKLGFLGFADVHTIVTKEAVWPNIVSTKNKSTYARRLTLSEITKFNLLDKFIKVLPMSSSNIVTPIGREFTTLASKGELENSEGCTKQLKE